jgi:hypothetical protein
MLLSGFTCNLLIHHDAIRNADAISRDAEQCGLLRIKKRIKIPLEFTDCSTFKQLKSALPKAAHPHF